MKCNKCNAEWNISYRGVTYIDSCPICGADYTRDPSSREFQAPVELLQTLIVENGVDILNNFQNIFAYLNDYFPQEKAFREDYKSLYENGVINDIISVASQTPREFDWTNRLDGISIQQSNDQINQMINRISGGDSYPGTDFGSAEYYLSQYSSVSEYYKTGILEKAIYCDPNNKQALKLMVEYNLSHNRAKDAVTMLENNIAGGDLDSLYTLVDFILEGKIPYSSKSKAEGYLQYAASLGDSRAYYKLGNMYLKGNGGDYSKATEWFMKAAEEGIVEAEYSLYALFYQFDETKSESIKHLQKAADGGFLPARYDLAIHLLYGDDIKEDKSQAVRILDECARRGYNDAIEKLIFMFKTGFCVNEDADMVKTYTQMKGDS